MNKYLETIKKDIKCLEKLADRLEVLDILKDREVDLSWLVWTGNYVDYNERFKIMNNDLRSHYHLTEDEYVKIKEWLEDE